MQQRAEDLNTHHKFYYYFYIQPYPIRLLYNKHIA